MDIDYLDYLPEQFYGAAVKLFLDALGDKLLPVLGETEQTQQLLEQTLDPTHCFCAVADGKLVGLLAVQDHKGSLLNPNLRSLCKAYGLFGGLYRMAGLVLMHHSTAEDEWYVDGVAIADGMRGQGVGSRLMAMFEEEALKQTIRTLSLDVIDTNPKAEKLYQRLGYEITKVEAIMPLNWLFHFPFQTVTSMKKELSKKAQ